MPESVREGVVPSPTHPIFAHTEVPFGAPTRSPTAVVLARASVCVSGARPPIPARPARRGSRDSPAWFCAALRVGLPLGGLAGVQGG